MPAAESATLPSPLSLSDRVYLRVEYAALFFALPTLLLFRQTNWQAMAMLMGGAVVACVWLARDRGFDRRQLVNLAGALRGTPAMLGVFAVLGFALVALTRALLPDQWLSLPRANPGLWRTVVILYPLLSVVPQELIWRAFLMHRYEQIFGGRRGLVMASAAAFGYAHIIMGNPVAVILTLVGGAIFAHTYAKRRSLLLVVIEHALYGCLLFTIGLGGLVYLHR